MREYYGSLEECREYIEDKNHKAVAWKEHPFSFELKNTTKYTLELRRRGEWCWGKTFAEVKPEESIAIDCKTWWKGRIEVSAKDDPSLTCDFLVGRGVMVERNLVEAIEEGRLYIAPIFHHGIVKIVTCRDCSPNFGVNRKYQPRPFAKPYNTLKVGNHTKHTLILSIGDRVIQRIRSKKTAMVGVPKSCVIYVDTEAEEIAWQREWGSREKKILKVNGCCIEIENGIYHTLHEIIGPALSEPYIRHLYSHGKTEEEDIAIWCNTIDYRID